MKAWSQLAEAPNLAVAEAWVSLLRSNNIPARLHPRDLNTFMGIPGTSVRVLVATLSLEQAQELIAPTT